MHVCRSMNSLPREEQDRLRAIYTRTTNQQHTANPPFANNQPQSFQPPPNRPQPVSLVEIADEELGVIQDMNLTETVMMAAQMVEILGVIRL